MPLRGFANQPSALPLPYNAGLAMHSLSLTMPITTINAMPYRCREKPCFTAASRNESNQSISIAGQVDSLLSYAIAMLRSPRLSIAALIFSFHCRCPAKRRLVMPLHFPAFLRRCLASPIKALPFQRIATLFPCNAMLPELCPRLTLLLKAFPWHRYLSLSLARLTVQFPRAPRLNYAEAVLCCPAPLPITVLLSMPPPRQSKQGPRRANRG